MESFQNAIFDLLAEGQELSGAEKGLVNHEVEQFVQDYRRATGEDPQALFGTIYLIAPRLEAFGFKIPTVDRWREEDMVTIRHYAERKGVRLGKERQ